MPKQDGTTDDGGDRSRTTSSDRSVSLAVVAIAILVFGVGLLTAWSRVGHSLHVASLTLVGLGAILLVPTASRALITALEPSFGSNEVTYRSAYGESVVARFKKHFERVRGYRLATDNDRVGLDVAFLDRTAAQFTSHGFREVGDVVDLPTEQMTLRHMLRIMISADGVTVLFISHTVLKEYSKLIMSNESRNVVLKTEISDGAILICSNSARGSLLTPPPAVCRILVVEETPPLDVLELHLQELGRRVNQIPVPMETLEAVLAMEDRHGQLASDFRKQIGYVDPEEIRRIALGSGKPEFIAERAAQSADEARRWELASRGSRHSDTGEQIDEMSIDDAC